MDALVKMVRIGIIIALMVYFLGTLIHSLYVVVHTEGSPLIPLVWVLGTWLAAAVIFMVGWLAVVFAIYGTRSLSERARCWRVRRSGRPFVILTGDRANAYIDSRLDSLNSAWSRGIPFEGEMGRWCLETLEGSYRVSRPLISGSRIVTFSNPNDAFAFKMRWA